MMKKRVFFVACGRALPESPGTVFASGRSLFKALLLTGLLDASYPAVAQTSSIELAIGTSAPMTGGAPIVTPEPGSPPAATAKTLSAQVTALSSGFAETKARFSQPITFDEVAIGASVNETYRDRGIIFGGSGPKTVSDAAAPDSPVLSGTPTLEGDISGYFVLPGTNEPATVYFLGWNIGYLDAIESLRMDFFGPAGETLFSLQNPRNGYLRYAARGGSAGIASWRFHIVAQELAGFGVDDIFFSIPGEEDGDREKGQTDCARGNPVNPAVGNKFQFDTDYRGLRPLPLAITRAYNSSDGTWRFFARIEQEPGGRIAQVIRKDGQGLTFAGAPGSNIWLATSTDITGQLTSTRDLNGAISGWQYRTLDDQVEQYDAGGRLVRLASRAGLAHTVSYTDTEVTVTHGLGGSVVYQLDAQGRITSAADPAGNSYGYRYNSDGMLERVVYPGASGEQFYHYEDPTFPDLLTGITDATGNRFATWRYDNKRRAISSEHAGGADLTRFDYTFTDDPLYPQTTVTNALGKRTTYHYVRVNGARKVFYVSGHASENCVAANQRYNFDANAFIASYKDWNGNLTTFTRDNRGRELTRTEAVGTADERQVITRWHAELNLPEVIVEPGRSTYYNYDDVGNEISRVRVDTNEP
jgi:YD repeat-containing protein